MKALKGLLIYVGIVLAMIVGMAILLFAGMYFFPSFRILGIGVVHGNRQSKETIVIDDYTDYERVEINVNSKNIDIDVNAVNTTVNSVVGDLSVGVFGLAYDITEYSVVQETSVIDNVLRITLNVTEPNGLISYTGSKMKVTIPSSLENVSLNVGTKGADIDLEGVEGAILNLTNLTVSTNSANFTINNCYQDVENKKLNLENLILSTNKGNFYFHNIENVVVKNTIKVSGNNSHVKFNNLIGSMNIVGEGITLSANHIKTGLNGFEFFCDNGSFKLNKLETPVGVENAIVSEHSNIEIGEIIGETGIISTFGSISINTLQDNTMIKSEHGNVYVKTANDDLNITTEYGNITVDDYKRNGVFTSKRGNINVKNTGEYEDRVYTKIVNEDGEVNVENNINKLLVETTGKSKATIIFKQIKGGLENPNDVFEHRVNIGVNGSATVYLPTVNYNTPFKFKAYGNISGEISGFTNEYLGDTVKSSEDYQFYPKASEEYKEACQKSCYFEFYGTIVFRGYQNV